MKNIGSKMINLFLFSLFTLVQGLDYDIVTDYSVNDCLFEKNTPNFNKYFERDANGFPYCAQYVDSDGLYFSILSIIKCLLTDNSPICVPLLQTMFRYYFLDIGRFKFLIANFQS